MSAHEYCGQFDEQVRDILREPLERCTPKQRDLFNRMYGSIEKIEREKMRWAYQQIMSTLANNEKDEEK